MTDNDRGDVGADSALLEREAELGTIASALDRTRSEGNGGTLLIEGPAGIGKTSLMGELGRRAGDEGFRVMSARGSEIERDFGFGIVRQLFDPLMRSLDADARARLFSGPAGLAAAIFGMAETGSIDVGAAEASLYGLFWLIAGLVENEPIALVIDDAHWADTASLRFFGYLGRRLDGLPLLLGLAARPNEPGLQAETLRGLTADLDPPTISPSLLSETATATIVRDRLGYATSAPVAAACHEATGGNPLLVEELVAELDADADDSASLSAAAIATMGPKRIAAGVIERARGLDRDGPEVARAVAVLGDGADLRAVAALAALDVERATAIVDRLAGASILVHASGHRFAHPLLGTAVYESIPAAARSAAHAAAADLLASHGAATEEIAAHLLRCEPGSTADAVAVLDHAARNAAERGAPDSVATYLRRALEEVSDRPLRGELLQRLGSAEVALRDPASIGHLQEAAELANDPAQALRISLQLCEVMSIAGLWDATVATVDAALERFGASELPGVLELEALRAAYRGYDPALAADFAADLPRLLALVQGRHDDDSSHLRWVLAGVGAIGGLPREEILELIGPPSQNWTLVRDGRESSLVNQALYALLMLDALDGCDRIAASLLEEGRSRGSLLAMICGVGYAAALDQRRGRLASSEANLNTVLELIGDNELGLMALTTLLDFCIDTVLERRALDPVADSIETLEMPAPFGGTYSGGIVHELRAAVRASRGDRPGAVAELRAAAAIVAPMRASPRSRSWRSRLALALPDEARDEALALAREELEEAEEIDSSRAIGLALRTLGVLTGGEAGIDHLRRSVTTLEDSPSPLERARSLAELGAALRRGNRRAEARERLLEAADLAQRCGAERLEDQVAAEMRVAGARPRRRAISGPDSLTPAELRVAPAAAAGASNREIGQDLFVSLRTVEMHLTNSYRKLGISSRAGLAAAIPAASELDGEQAA